MTHLSVAEQQELLRINASAVDELAKLRARCERLEALLREGVEGFGRVLVATSDDAAVRDWQRRGRAALAVEEFKPGMPECVRELLEAFCWVQASEENSFEDIAGRELVAKVKAFYGEQP